MKVLKVSLMVMIAPIISFLALFVWLYTELTYVPGLMLGLFSTVIVPLGVVVFIAYSPQNGVTLLVMVLLASPMGLPLVAI